MIANPIYREVIPRELASVTADVMVLPARSWALPDGRLDVDGLFDAFVAFWRRNAEPMVRGQYLRHGGARSAERRRRGKRRSKAQGMASAQRAA